MSGCDVQSSVRTPFSFGWLNVYLSVRLPRSREKRPEAPRKGRARGRHAQSSRSPHSAARGGERSLGWSEGGFGKKALVGRGVHSCEAEGAWGRPDGFARWASGGRIGGGAEGPSGAGTHGVWGPGDTGRSCRRSAIPRGDTGQVRPRRRAYRRTRRRNFGRA